MNYLIRKRGQLTGEVTLLIDLEMSSILMGMLSSEQLSWMLMMKSLLHMALRNAKRIF